MYTGDEEYTRKAYNSGETWPADDPWHTLTHEYVTAQVQNFLAVSTSSESQILNAGAADTRYACIGTVYDCDIAEKKLSTSQHPIHASITELPCQSGSFDFVICVGSVLNYCDAVKAISELSRVLRSGGRIILEFERSHSAEFLFTKHYGQDVFRKHYLYGENTHSLWLYSEAYIDKILNSHSLRIDNKLRFHTVSSLVARFTQNEAKAARLMRHDHWLRKLSAFLAHNVIYVIHKE